MMHSNALQTITTYRKLGDGLVLRCAVAEDVDALAAFNAAVHAEPDNPGPDEGVEIWTRDLMSERHPTFRVPDFTVVEDTHTGQIVSSLNLISQTWSYEDVTFKVGRPELVGTHEDYRNRGLIRAQFEEVHRWSEARCEMVQAITGIPYYYRLFGYEMAMNLGGGRRGFLHAVPELKDGQDEPYRIRPAQVSDLDFIASVYEIGSRRSLVSCRRSTEIWQYELEGRSPGSINLQEMMIIEELEGRPLGYLTHSPHNRGTEMLATFYELDEGVPWALVTPTVMRYLVEKGQAHAARDRKKPFESIGFHLGEAHPVYDVLGARMPKVLEPYAWYLRVPHLAEFLNHIRPVLDKRLKASAFRGYSGEMKITFYRSGVRFRFEAGEIATIEDWKPAPQGHSGDLAFPDLTFLQMVFGYRTFKDLEYAFADCWSDSEEARGLIEALFPKKASDVWPIA